MNLSAGSRFFFSVSLKLSKIMQILALS